MTPDWMDDAACKNVGTDDFFPPVDSRGNTLVSEREARAKAVCKTCAVKAECLDEALAYNDRGIWGGMNEKERKQELTRRVNAGTWREAPRQPYQVQGSVPNFECVLCKMRGNAGSIALHQIRSGHDGRRLISK